MSRCILCGTPTNREPVEHVAAEGLVGRRRTLSARGMGAVIRMTRAIVIDHCSIPGRRHKKYSTGITTNVSTVELTIPPTIGAAIRFITSAPAP